MKEKDVAGYSIFIDSRVQTLPDRINHKEDMINIAGLKTGDYYIGAKCMYYKVVNGKKYFVWTEPVIKKFSISVPVPKSPVLAYLDNFLMRVDNSRGTVSISMMLMVFSLLLSLACFPLVSLSLTRKFWVVMDMHLADDYAVSADPATFWRFDYSMLRGQTYGT